MLANSWAAGKQSGGAQGCVGRNGALARIGNPPSVVPDLSGEFDRSMQHHLKDLLFKDGVYDPEETVETFSHAKNGYLGAMEGRAVVA